MVELSCSASLKVSFYPRKANGVLPLRWGVPVTAKILTRATDRRIGLVAFLSLTLVLIALVQPQGHFYVPTDALPFPSGTITVTGDYVVGSVDLPPQKVKTGSATGTIPISGIPAGADVVAAFLYWETIANTIEQHQGVKFRGLPVRFAVTNSQALTGNTAPCFASGGWHSNYTMIRFRPRSHAWAAMSRSPLRATFVMVAGWASRGQTHRT